MKTEVLPGRGTAVQTPEKKTAVRTVFGRIETTIDGKVVRLEMRKDGIFLRRKHTRRVFRLAFADAWQVANGQGLFQFQTECSPRNTRNTRKEEGTKI